MIKVGGGTLGKVLILALIFGRAALRPPRFDAALARLRGLQRDNRAMAVLVSSERFVGRAQELAALQDASGTVVIAGDAGVGKSRRVAELERRAQAHGKLVLLGECLELTDGELAYAPIVSAPRPVLRDGGVLDPLSDYERRELARLWPERGPETTPPGPASQGSSQARVFSLLLGLLRRLGEGRPVVFVVEDVEGIVGGGPRRTWWSDCSNALREMLSTPRSYSRPAMGPSCRRRYATCCWCESSACPSRPGDLWRWPRPLSGQSMSACWLRSARFRRASSRVRCGRR